MNYLIRYELAARLPGVFAGGAKTPSPIHVSGQGSHPLGHLHKSRTSTGICLDLRLIFDIRTISNNMVKDFSFRKCSFVYTKNAF